MIERPRLADPVAAALSERRVVTVEAAAGFGKTTLARQLADSWRGSVVWVSLDPGDQSSQALWNLVLAAARGEAVGDHELGEARGRALRALQEHDEPLLVIDDGHHLAPQARDELAHTAERTRGIVRLLYVARPTVPIPWQRLRAGGDAFAVDPCALAFDEGEVAEVCPELADAGMEAGPVSRWPAMAGLRRAGLVDPEAPSLSSFVGDYIAREVFSALDATTVALLLRASLFDRWTVRLLAALGERSVDDVAERLRSLAPLVTVADDGEWRRLDPALQGYLAGLAESRLPPEERVDCLSAAAPVLVAEGAFDDAFEALVRAGDHEAAAELLTNHVQRFETEGRHPDLRQRFELLPRSIRLDPKLAIGFGWALLATGGPGESLEWCRSVGELHDAPRHVAASLDVLRSFAHRTNFEHDESWAAAEQVLSQLPEPPTPTDAGLAAMAMVQQVQISLWRGHFDDLRVRFDQLRLLLDRGGHRLSRAKSAGQRALAYASAGHIADAEFWIEESHRVGLATGLLGTHAHVEHDLARAAVLLEDGRDPDAEGAVREVLDRCRDDGFNFPTALVSAALALGRLLLDERPDEGRAVVEAIGLDRWRHDHYVAARLETFHAEHAARVGERGAAMASIDHVLTLDVDDSDSSVRLARVALELGDPVRARAAMPSTASAEAAGPRSVVARALVAARLNEADDLESVLALASRVGLLREVIVGAGPLADDVLSGSWPAVPPAYLRRLKTMAEARRPRDPVLDTLSARELEILPVIATRLTLPEIAEQLYISENTLKSHLRSIYRKLGVGSRREAAEVAESCGAVASQQRH